jgi:hypothetical protein
VIAHGAGADDSFQHMNEAEAFVKSFKSQLRDLGTSFRILKPLIQRMLMRPSRLSGVIPSNMASDANG